MKTKQIAISILIVIFLSAIPVQADNFIRAYTTYSGTSDTVGMAEHFLIFGTKIPIFLPPYTFHVDIHPLTEGKYKARIDCYELAPGYRDHHEEKEIEPEKWQTIEGLESKGLEFDFHYIIFKDTVEIFNYLAKDSLTTFESIHYKARIWRGTYADYKWEMRKGYLENTYNFYRKDHKVKRAGKMDFYVYPSSYSSPFINNLTGYGLDIPGNSIFTVFNEGFDTALPQYAQLFVIYENLGYSSRALAVGYSRYFLDDIYRARAFVSGLSPAELKALLNDEYPSNRLDADIVSGAFVRFLIELKGVPTFKTLYEKSRPGNIATKDVYDISFDDIVSMFIEYQRNLRMDEPNAAYFSNIYNSQMWFDQALEYDIWLGSQPVKKDYHLKSLGATLFHVGDYDESKKAYTAFNQRNPDKDLPKYLLGLALLRTGKTKQAMRMLEQASDSISEATLMLGEIYLDKGEIDKAETYILKVSEYPDYWTSLLKARLAFAEGKNSIAVAILRKALAQSESITSNLPGEARGYISAAYGFMFSGKFEEAESELNVAVFVENRPYYLGSCYLAFGRLYDLEGQRDKAKAFYKKVSEIKSSKYDISLAKQYMKKAFKL